MRNWMMYALAYTGSAAFGLLYIIAIVGLVGGY